MPLATPLLDYTDKDFDALRFRLRNLVRSVFPEWTDFNVANFGNILLELFAHTGDVLTFYQDNQGRQSRITTATQRKALLGLVKLIGFTPGTATAATSDVRISLPAPVAFGAFATFPKGTVVKTEAVTDAIRYQLLADATIPAGIDFVLASAENSETRAEAYVSTGLPNQALQLLTTPFIDGSGVVTADNGTFTQVENFLDSTPTSLHYTVQVDQNDRATIKFGNGINGAIPTGNISSTYKVGGGAAGRVEMNKLRAFDQSTWTDSLGNALQPSVTNAAASSGGTDRQGVEQIKQRAPASLRVLNRSVAREDFEINARRLPAVARALMLTKNEEPSIAENAGELYIVPVGGGVPSSTLKALVLNQVTVVYPSTLTFDVSIKDAVYRTINVFAIVYFRAGVNKVAGAAAIKANLATFFAPQAADGTDNTRVDFGANVRDAAGNITAEVSFSDVFDVVKDTTGVRKIGAAAADFTIDGAHDDVILTRKQFPKLGVVTITDGDTGTVY